jgi:hypothetical protein
MQPSFNTISDPLRHFRCSPDFDHLTLMLYIKFPQSLWKIESFLRDRRIMICGATVAPW